MASRALLERVTVVAVALLLLWRIIHVNVGLYDASGQPHQDTRASLGDIIDDNPAEIAALVMLAKDREAAGDIAGASKAYRVAIDLAPLNREVLALASAHFLRQDDVAGLALLGRLMTSYPDSRQQAFAALAGLLALNRYQVAIGAMAASDPPWLAPFVADACQRGTDPAILAPLVLKVSASDAAAPAAAACVVDKLRAAGQWELAYHLWLNLIPRTHRGKLGFVFNGGFELPPGPAGFDWRLQQGRERHTGHEAAIVRATGAEGQRALRVAYNGNRQAGLADPPVPRAGARPLRAHRPGAAGGREGRARDQLDRALHGRGQAEKDPGPVGTLPRFRPLAELRDGRGDRRLVRRPGAATGAGRGRRRAGVRGRHGVVRRFRPAPAVGHGFGL